MNIGYDKALYLLPFDHRHSYVQNLFKTGSGNVIVSSRTGRFSSASVSPVVDN